MTLRSVGFWTTEEHPLLPDPTYHIDHRWDMGERIKVIRYLRDAPKANAKTSEIRCRLKCSSSLGFGFQTLTDGDFIWPESFAHYVETHGVKPPEDFLQHIRNNEYRIPRDSAIIIKNIKNAGNE